MGGTSIWSERIHVFFLQVWAHLVKDWTESAPEQWGPIYAHIVHSLLKHLGLTSLHEDQQGVGGGDQPLAEACTEALPLVLVPGCAQGRMVFEIALKVNLSAWDSSPSLNLAPQSH